MIKTCKLDRQDADLATVYFGKTKVQIPSAWLVDGKVTLKEENGAFYKYEAEDKVEPEVEYVGIAAKPETEENA